MTTDGAGTGAGGSGTAGGSADDATARADGGSAAADRFDLSGERRPNVLLVVLDCVRAQNTGLYGYDRATTPFLTAFAGGPDPDASSDADPDPDSGPAPGSASDADARSRPGSGSGADRGGRSESLPAGVAARGEADGPVAVYDHAVAPASWSLPSHASIFTGLAAAEHGVDDFGRRLAPGHTVFEALADRGYDTGVFSENPWLTEMDAGLKDAFDHVVGRQKLLFPEALDPDDVDGGYDRFLRRALADDHPLRSLGNGLFLKLQWDHPGLVPDRLRDRMRGATYVDSFLDWSADRDRWAACINLLDAHSPYVPPAGHDRWDDGTARSIQESLSDAVWSFHAGDRSWSDRERLVDLYDGCVSYVDEQVARLVGALRERGDLSDTLLVITSDHGEGFGEPSPVRDERLAAHAAGLAEPLVHVPLVVNFPARGSDPDSDPDPDPGADSDSDPGDDPDGENDHGRSGEDSARSPSTPDREPPTGERGWVDRTVTLAGFPGLVENVMAGRQVYPDRPLVTSWTGINEQLVARASEFLDGEDLADFEHPMRAAYDRAGDRRLQYVEWRDRGAVVDVSRTGDPRVIERGDRESTLDGRVEAAFDSLAARDVAKAKEQSGPDESVEQRLEELGYL